RRIEPHLIGALVIEQREVARLEADLPAVLTVAAAAFELHVQEEHRVTRACNVLGRVTHDGWRGMHFREEHFSGARAREAGTEGIQIEWIGDDRGEGARREIVPELEPAPRREAGCRERLESSHS